MKSLKQRLILYLFSFFIIIFVVAIWSTTLLTEWSVDYGVYYAGSYFLDENYNLYKECKCRKLTSQRFTKLYPQFKNANLRVGTFAEQV